MIMCKNEFSKMENRSFIEMVSKNEIRVPNIQRPIVGTPDSAKWVSDEILKTARQMTEKEIPVEVGKNIVINFNNMVIFEKDGVIYIYDAQQRTLYIAAFIDACKKVFKNFSLNMPDIKFERQDMKEAYRAFCDNVYLPKTASKDSKTHLCAMNRLSKFFVTNLETDIGTHGENGKKGDAWISSFASNIEKLLNAIYFEVTICATKEIAMEKFLNANSGGIQMTKTNFCEAITTDAAEKLGIYYNANTHKEYLAQAVQTWGVYKTDKECSPKVNSLREVMHEYITKDANSFNDFCSFLQNISNEICGPKYKFMKCVNRNEFLNLYFLLIASKRTITSAYTTQFFSRIGYLSLFASAAGARGSYFASLVSNVQHAICQQKSVAEIESIIGKTVSDIAPVRFVKDNLKTRINTNPDIHKLALNLVHIEERDELFNSEYPTEVEHLIPVSKNGQEGTAHSFDRSTINCLGNKYLIDKEHNSSAKNKSVEEKYYVYFTGKKVPGTYLYDANLDEKKIKELSVLNNDELTRATLDRNDYLIDILCRDKFFSTYFLV